MPVASLFFGLGVLEPSVSTADLMRDPEWPHYSTKTFPVDPVSGDRTFRFDYIAPLVHSGTYFGTVVLWDEIGVLTNHGTGSVLDRIGFDVTLGLPIPVPDVSGDSAQQATTKLEQAGLVPYIQGPTGIAAQVWSQSPAANTLVPPGSTVTCTMSYVLKQ